MILLDHLSRRKTWPIACVSATKTNCYPHDVDDVLTADRPIVFVVSSAPRRDGGGAGAAPADCLVLPEGGEGGDAGHVLLVRAGGHVAQRLQLPLGAVVTHVAVEDGGNRGKIGE